MILKAVKFYQGVAIDGRVETHVVNNAPRIGTAYSGAKELQISEVENGILIKKGDKATLATWNNVQYVEYDLPQSKAEKAK
jgi:hypothetical protein